ncbi:hypothetical protein GZ77_22715 [Endozoicomonas montiporae]|uniref:Uncharacterized protein n=2 Tax=Endozoicomonas montiporae TaxID=1027273 RepID=A0A081N0F1_9GAMM|nr:hypothetical protein [Endozoicomonas montiporae]AMO54380.1 hypothetical protein EZMO1_0108 [Endozoicomonas montiporae CL-33]KEQ11924.1 hypothetical protein GZ77_22715 [Endozoicomonas montiporae]
MTLPQKLLHTQQVLENALSHVNDRSTLIQRYLAFVQNDMPARPYDSFTDDMMRWLDELERLYDKPTLNSIHKLALVKLMLHSLPQLDAAMAKHLPDVCVEAVERWFESVCDQASDESAVLDRNSDLFKKDLAISALNLWPSHSICHYEPRALPRGFLLSGGGKQFFRGICLLYGTLKNRYRTMYELHMEDRRTNPHFLEAGWQSFYIEIARRLESEPDVAGIFAQSWFWDPVVGQQSSKMAYLRQLPESGGASFFRLNSSTDADHIALQNKKRRKLFEQGEYTPTSYLMVWGRSDLIHWAKDQTLITG